jgi:hypothetical protein
MDRETRDAFAALAATLAVVARRQMEQREMLAQVVRLLTPEPPAEGEPSLAELVERLVQSHERGTAAVAGKIKDFRKAVADLPMETARAIDYNLGPLAKERAPPPS